MLELSNRMLIRRHLQGVSMALAMQMQSDLAHFKQHVDDKERPTHLYEATQTFTRHTHKHWIEPRQKQLEKD
jgi:hypothetical protein